jgi:hypothetical protein
MQWIQKNVLKLTDKEISDMDKQIQTEMKLGKVMNPQQIAAQGQAELTADVQGSKNDNAPTGQTVSSVSPESGDTTDNRPIKGDLSLKESGKFKTIKRIL